MPLAAGADRNRRDARRGRTPLHCACENGKLRCVDALLAREASVVQADHANRTCVDLLREASLPALMICAIMVSLRSPPTLQRMAFASTMHWRLGGEAACWQLAPDLVQMICVEAGERHPAFRELSEWKVLTTERPAQAGRIRLHDTMLQTRPGARLG